MTLEDVANELGCWASKVSRVETARGMARPSEVRHMLSLYSVTGEPADHIMALVRDVKEPGWWEQYSSVLPPRYTSFIGLEAEAKALRTYEPIVIPGLLQTEDYARAAIHATMPNVSDDEVERRVEVLMTRQNVLERKPDPLEVYAVIDEAALRRLVGGPEVMTAQLAVLRHVTRRPNIRIQVLPYWAGATASPTGPLVLIQFPDPEDRDVGYIENWTGDVYLERPEQVERCARMLDDLCAAALSPQDSVQYMESISYQEGGAG